MGVVGVELKGWNDLVIDGMKFFGNVMYVINGWMFVYGMIMFDFDINEVVNVLKVKKDKIELKGIKLICFCVMNIKLFFFEEK